MNVKREDFADSRRGADREGGPAGMGENQRNMTETRRIMGDERKIDVHYPEVDAVTAG